MTNLHLNFIINIDFIHMYLLEAHKSDPHLFMVATSTIWYDAQAKYYLHIKLIIMHT